jgi:hypothetical protein
MPYIAIDTNIFEHLLNPDRNLGSHIDKLLGHLIRAQYQLLVDSTKKIGNEYEQMIVPIIRNRDDTGQQLQLLRHWMKSEVRHMVDLTQTDNLMQQIRRVIYEKDEHADRAFVYVVCRRDSILVTNDHTHILGRRNDLLRKTKKERGKNTDIQCSNDAYDNLHGTGEPA